MSNEKKITAGLKALAEKVADVVDDMASLEVTTYTGSFNMKGTFGILRNFRLLSIDGTGKQTFNVERGLLEKDVQQYKLKLSTTMIFNLPGVAPELNIDQKMSVELLEN